MRKTIESSQTSMIGILKTPVLTTQDFPGKAFAQGFNKNISEETS